MDKREESLREALLQNAEECERWERYKKENETAIENLQEFSKHLTVDVMVPVGRKCFMPGQLIHTNEVLVGHYQGYFSKCTAHKAKEICNMRIERAKERLQKLETEAQLWTNKLEMPHIQGVVPNSEQMEIIEDYDEENEKRWREQQKQNIKKSKLKEKINRDDKGKKLLENQTSDADKNDADIFKMLEEAELMEELEKELDKLQIDEVNDETLKKLMTGELKPTKPKQRTAHDLKPIKTSEASKRKLDGAVKKNTPDFSLNRSPPINNNARPNPVISDRIRESTSEQDLDTTEEVRIIKEQAKYLPTNDQVGFYEYQVEIVRKKIENLKMTSQHDMEEKLHQMTVLEELEELLELAEEETNEITDNETDSINDEKISMIKKEKEEEAADKNKRRIQFALEDETLVFRQNEAVSQMLPKPLETEKPMRDIIKLDDDIFPNKSIEQFIPSIDKKEIILDKVEKNLQFVSNNQSQIDCDLISKIINESEEKERTIYIKFKHSIQEPTTELVEESTNDFIPGKPSDFYDLYLKQQKSNEIESKYFYVNSYTGEDEVKAPILRESNRQEAYADPKSKFSLPNCESKESEIKAKPILRNKSAVERETHYINSNPNKPPSKKRKKVSINEDEIMSAYNKVMNDVIEKPLTKPEPLPNMKFIDAHTPKKRISRFKQNRTNIEKT